MSIFTLTTDFGYIDPYVAQMKGAILKIHKNATIIDVTHNIPPQDILKGAVIAASLSDYFPEGTIHLAVVDPGVGTSRRPIVVNADNQFFIGPDNGIMTFILKRFKKSSIRQISDTNLLPDFISPTFHGRDVFAPIGAHIAEGLDINSIGPKVSDPVLLNIPPIRGKNGELIGHVLFSDNFGNLITDIPATELTNRYRKNAPKIIISDKILTGLHLTYAEVEVGKPIAIIGSTGFLEIAINSGRADQYFNAGPETEIKIKF